MPITKELIRESGMVCIYDRRTGELMIAVSERIGLTNSQVLRLLHQAQETGDNGEPGRVAG